jgi:EmrB/QacA subfamily drug resistance transporter
MSSEPRFVLDPTTERLLPWVVAIAFFMQTLDTTILNTTLPRMAIDLGESPVRMQSVVVAYSLTVALLIPASGWLADRFGTRRAFLGALVIFSLGSLFCALSPSLTWLVIARVIQGIGGALLLPVGRLTILRAFPRSDRLRVLAFVTIPGLLGPLVGPPLGGWLVEVATWHWVFLINIPVGVLGVFATLRVVPALRSPMEQRFDWVGFVLFSAGLVMVSLGLQGLGEQALAKATSLLLAVGGLAAMAAYWMHAARVDNPLFTLRLFKIPTFSIGVVGNLFARLGTSSAPFLIPIFLQVGLGYSPTTAGFSMVASVVGAIALKSFAVPVIERLGYRTVLSGNTLLVGTLIASFALLDRSTPLPVIVVLLAVFGLVNSMQFTAMNTLTLSDLDEERASAGNSLLSVVMQLAMGLGVAAAGAMLAAFGGSPPPTAEPEVLHMFRATFICMGLLTAAAASIFLQLGRREGPSGPASVVEEG